MAVIRCPEKGAPRADEARIGQKNNITRAGHAAAHDRRHRRTDARRPSSIVGAIRPKQGKGVARVLPGCHTEGMSLHLAAISGTVEPGRGAALLVDQAGSRLPALLAAPDTISSIPLPPKCPELNPQENA